MQISVELMYLILQGGLYTCVVCKPLPFYPRCLHTIA